MKQRGPPLAAVSSLGSRALVLSLLLVLIAIVERCDCFKVRVYSPAAAGGVSLDGVGRLSPGLSAAQQQNSSTATAAAAAAAATAAARQAAAGPARPPLNLFSRFSPLKVRLEHRELASNYSAYVSPLGSDPRTSGVSVGSSGGGEDVGIDVHHLVFSYDPTVVSPETQQPFRYLEGQSVSFVNLRDARSKQTETPAPVSKPRLYSVASSLLAPDEGLQHSFSLCVKRHRYRDADGQEDPSRDGLCSSLLCSAPIGTEFEVAGNASSAAIAAATAAADAAEVQTRTSAVTIAAVCLLSLFLCVSCLLFCVSPVSFSV
ncbi:ferredoxin NADP+ oxidoreductase, putative [Eimeria praecox]|uniref:ferredoxin--NADP(+) reductase n=1 Tax=Eimeria praecox TaxID=51316 RepID=U6G834_9EIME|nr:ferredoxin NADP+ oxidoreductase, putative [Eimeria praecox]